MWRRVDLVWTDASEERIASIFRVEKSASEKPAWAGGQQLTTYTRWFLARRFFYPEDWGDRFLWNVGSHIIYTTPHPRSRHSSIWIFVLSWDMPEIQNVHACKGRRRVCLLGTESDDPRSIAYSCTGSCRNVSNVTICTSVTVCNIESQWRAYIPLDTSALRHLSSKHSHRIS
jgi:hypothetical protein